MPAARWPAVDRRLDVIRHLNRPYAFRGCGTKAEWTKRAEILRRRMRLALGLWPEPPRGPLRALRSVAAERDGYSIERVRFESHPGFFVTGNLYRPRPAPKGHGACPALLVPHGHWKEGRLVNRGPEDDSMPGLCINIALRGALAFSYDMIGYNDSRQLSHRFGEEASEELAPWGISLMGLQTFNSIRAVDFLRSMKEVDPQRLACTGASGGGTQTFILAALDERVRACAPAVMVSSVMQGGCLCENAPGLRWETNNMEIAALAAPRPQLLISCTGDWTGNTPRVEAPAVRRIYALYGKRAAQGLENYHQHARHNYNRKSREALYGWLGRLWFGIGEPAFARERPFTVEDPGALRLFPDGKPPRGGQSARSLTAYLKRQAGAHVRALRPDRPAKLKRFRAEAGALLAEALRAQPPQADALRSREEPFRASDGARVPRVKRVWLSRRAAGDLVHGVLLRPEAARAKVPLVVAVHPGGSFRLLDMASGAPGEALAALLENDLAVLALDTFEANPLAGRRPRGTIRHFSTYNPPALCQRVRDILTALAWAKARRDVESVHLLGLEIAGGWCLLARALAKGVRRTLVDAHALPTRGDEAYRQMGAAPGLRLAGGYPAAAALCAPAALRIHHTQGGFETALARDAYSASRAAGKLVFVKEKLDAAAQAAWLAGA